MRSYTLSDIKRAHVQKKDWEKQFPTIRFFSRPISFYLTYLILFVTQEPTHIVWLGFVVGIAGCLSFLFIDSVTLWLGTSLIMLFGILDAVDGNIARTTAKVSYYGKFLDAMIGEIIEAGYWVWLGIGLYMFPRHLLLGPYFLNHPEQKIVLVVAGSVVMFFRLFANMFQGAYYNYLAQKRQSDKADFSAITDTIKSARFRGNIFYALYVNFHTLTFQVALLAISIAANMVDIFLFLYVFYYGLRFVISMVFFCYRAYNNLS